MELSSGRQPTGVPGHLCGPSTREPHLRQRVFPDVLWIVGDGGDRRRQGRARLVQASEQVGAAGGSSYLSGAEPSSLDARLWPEKSRQISGVRSAQGFARSN
jgi:hypothetical protein